MQRWSPLLKLPSGDWRCQGRDLPVQQAAGGGVWVQLPEAAGIVALPLERRIDAIGGCPASEAIRHPIWVETLAEQHWRFGNGCLALEVDERGLIRLQDAQGVDQLSAPVQIKRYQDHGEFWDAWDLAGDYPQHPLPLPLRWKVEMQEGGPLLARVVLRGSFGDSTLRMDLILRADTPWLELQLTLDWHQTHELLRMVCPLAAPAVRWAADTSGGVLERPAAATTPGEQARWEVPVISWMASEAFAPGGGLGLLLDGPQGADAGPQHLGVSLLRGPTWPDPSADQGRHRHRLALMPSPQGWMRDGLPQAAIAFREPGWQGPMGLVERWQGFPALPQALTPVSLRSDPERAGTVLLQVLNPGAARVFWAPCDGGWRLEGGADAGCIPPGVLRELRLVRQSS